MTATLKTTEILTVSCPKCDDKFATEVDRDAHVNGYHAKVSSPALPAYLLPIFDATNSFGTTINETDAKIAELTAKTPTAKFTVDYVPEAFRTPEIMRTLNALNSGLVKLTRQFAEVATVLNAEHADEVATLQASRADLRKLYVTHRAMIAAVSPEVAAKLVKITGAVNLENPASQSPRVEFVKITPVNGKTESFETIGAAAKFLGVEHELLTAAYLQNAVVARWQDAPISVRFNLQVTLEGQTPKDYSVQVVKPSAKPDATPAIPTIPVVTAVVPTIKVNALATPTIPGGDSRWEVATAESLGLTNADLAEVNRVNGGKLVRKI